MGARTFNLVDIVFLYTDSKKKKKQKRKRNAQSPKFNVLETIYNISSFEVPLHYFPYRVLFHSNLFVRKFSKCIFI